MVKSEKTSYVTTLSYRLFERITSHFAFTTFKPIYQKSGISKLYESYIALMLFASVVAFFAAFAIGVVLHHLLFDLPLLQFFAAVLIFSWTVSLTVPVIFILYPLYRKNQRGKEIDVNLVYTTGYMGVLSAGGIPIERIFERATQVEQHQAIRDLTKRLITNIKLFGLDVTSSLRDIAFRSPSETFSKLFTGITNTVNTSGDLKSLLTFETRRLLHAKREQLKRTLRTLAAIGEIYISAIVVGPILFIVILTILSIIGNVTFGLSPVEQLNLLVFFGLPMLSTIFIIILNGVLPEEE